jgi:hypothetical protein
MFKRAHSIVLAAIAGLVLTNTAIADTSAGADTLFLTVTDLSQGTSYFYDTGLTIQTFSPDQWQYFDLSTDPNYQAFTSHMHPGDVVQYEVASATSSTTLPSILFTSNDDSFNPVGNVRLRQAAASLLSYLSYVNTTPSPTTYSAFLPATGPDWESSFESNIGIGSISASPGTEIFFYSEVARSPGSTPPALLIQLAGGWYYTSNGVLEYTTPD